MAAPRVTYTDLTNPRFLHPSDNINSIQIDKLEGPSDYRAWKRSMEISLSAKCKLGFVKGTVVPIPSDAAQNELWETCDNMVISWITSNLSSTIRKSVIYMSTSKEIWKNLEMRFSLTNDSRKYKLNRDLYEMKQGSLTVNEYYTALRSIWEELDSMHVLPTISAPAIEVKKLLEDIELQKDESKLFQFLNGLNDAYTPQRSQLLMLTPLPKVEIAIAMIQQEEAQREITSAAAMYSKIQPQSPDKLLTCTACKGRGHTADRCWTIVGYPK